jgi:class 3 adenylate cyclase
MGDARTGYANSGGNYLAYSVSGSGELALLCSSRWTISIDALEEEPHVSLFARRLDAFARCIRYDARGIGGSDPISPSIDYDFHLMAADALAVLDAVGVERAVLLAENAAVPSAIEIAASRPERVQALVCVNGFATLIADADSPHGHPRELVESFITGVTDPNQSWDVGGSDDVALIAPSLQHDAGFRDWWVRSSRRAASPATARAMLNLSWTSDARPFLSAVAAPTLVIHTRDNVFCPVGLGRYLADHIANAKYVELASRDHAVWGEIADDVVDEIEEFLTGRRSGTVDRVLATVLFTDIVDSTGRAAALGDHQWRALLDSHDAIVRAELARHGGREVNTTGDGFIGAFESPTQAVRAGQAMVEAAARQGVAIRVGVHTGECERRGDDLAGLTVHIAARVGALAASSEVLVSRTVRDLVAGSGLQFLARGEHELKGVPDTWQLFALEV